ncbi:major facilitator superfamily domain-containing protein [Anaeramoeba flamelloides]|uniref:Major facilitator superfamily domain-containing protein n=1 Tax=Anaeramoeba flamelloides TaxID=1746091 RepID=A0AAV8A7H5_9EUKA|nr:major facilitator superfamily domain-containing protein [Anaeramoeba flamelloides]
MKKKNKNEKTPYRQALFIYSVIITNFISGFIISPFIPDMLKNRLKMNPSEIGVASGLILGAFEFSQLVSSFYLGHLSDIYGRKRVLILSLISSGISLFLFGFAFSFLYILFVEIISGLSNSTYGISDAILGDLTQGPNLKYRSRLFGFLGATLALSRALGSLTTSLTFDQTCGIHYLKTNPYMLPCFVGALISFFGALLIILFYKETNKWKKKKYSNAENYLPINNSNPQSNTNEDFERINSGKNQNNNTRSDPNSGSDHDHNLKKGKVKKENSKDFEHVKEMLDFLTRKKQKPKHPKNYRENVNENTKQPKQLPNLKYETSTNYDQNNHLMIYKKENEKGNDGQLNKDHNPNGESESESSRYSDSTEKSFTSISEIQPDFIQDSNSLEKEALLKKSKKKKKKKNNSKHEFEKRSVCNSLKLGLTLIIKDRKLLGLYGVYSFNNLCNGCLFTVLVLYCALDKNKSGFGFTPTQIGYVFVIYGIVSLFFQLFGIKKFINYFGIINTYVFCGCSLVIIGCIFFVIVCYLIPHYKNHISNNWYTWAIITLILIPISCGIISMIPIISTLISTAASKKRQGLILGTGSSIGSVFRSLGPVIGGALFSLSTYLNYPQLSFFFISLMYILCIISIHLVKKYA